MELWELSARQSVVATLARYHGAGDRGQSNEVALCFLEGGSIEWSDGDPLIGREAIREFLDKAIKRGHGANSRKFIHHHVANPNFLRIDPEEAVVACYFQVLTDQGLDHWGRTVDYLVPADAGWLIKLRKGFIDGMAPNSWWASASSADNGPSD